MQWEEDERNKPTRPITHDSLHRPASDQSDQASREFAQRGSDAMIHDKKLSSVVLYTLLKLRG